MAERCRKQEDKNGLELDELFTGVAGDENEDVAFSVSSN